MTPRLLGITPGDERDLLPWLAALGEAGLPALLVREPMLAPEPLRKLVEFARVAIPFVALHTRHEQARALVATLPGLRLHGRFSELSELESEGHPFGVSCHSEIEVDAALHGGAEYVLLSPVWRPTSKPADTRPAFGRARFLAIARSRPVLALGGVTPRRHQMLLAGGGRGSAVLGGLFDAPSPSASRARLCEYLSSD